MSEERMPWVLIVLGDSCQIDWFVRIIRVAGYEGIECESPSAAMGLIAERDMPALVVFDLARSDKQDWLKSLWSKDTGEKQKTPPLLSVSAIDFDVKLEEADTVLKADAFLRLPCSDDYLLNVIDVIMQKNASTYRPLVLVVDDSPDMRNLLKVSLTSHGLRVLEAGNGAEALESAHSNAPDVIVLDHILPDTIGLALMSELQAGRHPFIIVITGDPTESLAEEYTSLGATAFVRKPFGVSLLVEMIGNLCRGRVPGDSLHAGGDFAAGALSRALTTELRRVRDLLIARDCRITDLERQVDGLLMELGRPTRYSGAT